MCRTNEEMCNEVKYDTSIDIALTILSKGKLTIEEIKDLDKQIKNGNFEL